MVILLLIQKEVVLITPHRIYVVNHLYLWSRRKKGNKFDTKSSRKNNPTTSLWEEDWLKRKTRKQGVNLHRKHFSLVL